MEEWFRFVVALPFFALVVGYCMPTVRYRRQIKADSEVAAVLPPGDDRDWFNARASESAHKLRRYREVVATRPGYRVSLTIAPFWILGLAGAVAWPPWTDPTMHVIDYGFMVAGFILGGTATVSAALGRDVHGRTPDQIEAETAAMAAEYERQRERKAKRAARRAARRRNRSQK